MKCAIMLDFIFKKHIKELVQKCYSIMPGPVEAGFWKLRGFDRCLNCKFNHGIDYLKIFCAYYPG